MELMFILPILLLVLLVFVELGTYLLAVQAIQGAAMAGAREATMPGATTEGVRATVVGALAGWSYASQLGPDDIQVFESPAEGSVTVSVSVNASQAAINPLPFIPGLDLSGKKISARFVMRKE